MTGERGKPFNTQVKGIHKIMKKFCISPVWKVNIKNCICKLNILYILCQYNTTFQADIHTIILYSVLSFLFSLSEINVPYLVFLNSLITDYPLRKSKPIWLRVINGMHNWDKAYPCLLVFSVMWAPNMNISPTLRHSD